MESPILSTYTNSAINRNGADRNNISQTNTRLFNVSANLMPSERQTSVGVFNPGAVTQTALDKRKYSMPRIFNPESSPSAVTSENFLSSKAISTPTFVHNIAQTKYAMVSNWAAEQPRFTNKVSVLA